MTDQPDPTLPAGAQRLRWPDVAKGACIVLVVLHHVVLKDYLFKVSATFDPVDDIWHDLTYALKPVRMPLFFAVSGFFAAGALARPWRSARRRIVSGYYLYVVWLMIFVGVYALDRETPANRVSGFGDLAGHLVWAASSMWFLYALVVYFVIAKLLRHLPSALVVGAAAVLSASVSGLGIEENNRFAVLAHLVYFLAGAYYPDVLRWIAARRWSASILAVAAATYAAGFAVASYAGLPWSATAFATSLIGVPLGIVLAVRCAPTRLGSALAWIGGRTLRVYVLHLAVLSAVLQVPLALAEGGPFGLAASLAYPVVMTALVVVACLVVHDLLVRLGGRWLFALPQWLEKWLDQRADQRTGQRVFAAATGQPVPVPVPATGAGAKVPSDPRSGRTE